jgi:exodeoxyribonuclease V alpha subunit
MEIRVTPYRKLFFDEKNFFGIYGADVNLEDLTENNVTLNDHGRISIKGITPMLNIGEEYIVKVKEEKGTKFVGTYILESIRQEKPVTITQQRIFLESILSPTQTENIFSRYSEGEDIVGMIETGEFDYNSIKGLGEKTFEKLREKVLSNSEMSEILIFLSKYGIKYNMIQKLIKEYKNPQIVMDKINLNPYLLTEVKGIGFLKADAIAKAVGYEMTSEHRIVSCIRYVIGEENKNGHSWIGRKQLLNRCLDLLNINKKYIENILNNGAKGVLNIDERFTREEIYKAEDSVAMKITQFKTQSKQLFETDELDRLLDAYCEKWEVELEKNQRLFFHDWNENNILFLIGGGGMGKSWLQRILLELIAMKNLTTALLAPTGKASKVMSNYTGKQASTIHRKIGVYDNEEDANGVIEEDIIIVDESSMCDIFILDKLLQAIVNQNAKILFVGDDFQLPSVGVGNFLYDIINSGCAKLSKLVKVFRQAEGGILTVATAMRHGEKFLNDTDDGRIQFGKDCLFHLTESKFIRDGYIHYYNKLLKLYKSEDILILSPTNKGKLGTVEINKEIQSIVNPESANKKEKAFGRETPIIFRVGDAVMSTVNSYKVETIDGGTADVFNGDTGVIVDIDETDKAVVVDYEGVVVKMKFETILTTLLHSWCTTIHKSQGSQIKAVIVIVDKSTKFQLNANLVYTGWSRAKDYMIVLGQAQTINYATMKFANMERRSFLQELLHKYNNGESKLLGDKRA